MAILKYRDKDGNFVVLPTGGMRELPIASSEVLGGVKVGENLSITEDGTLNAKASGTSVLSPGAILYDIEEKVIGKWINGKPIYQKTLIISDFNFSQSKDFTNDLFTEIELILGGEMYDTTSSTIRFVHANARKISSNTIRLYNTSSWDSIDAYTLRYTKTTDKENSFTLDMIIDHENITDAEIADAAAADKI